MLVELLVVIAIIGILIALLLPAVQAAAPEDESDKIDPRATQAADDLALMLIGVVAATPSL